MGSRLNLLKGFFETGTAEGDSSFLKDVFVQSEEYEDFISVPRSGPRLLLGSKGSGKSAILRYFRWQLQEADVPVILLRPKDIYLPDSVDSALGPLTRAGELAILSAVAGRIGSEFNGLVVGADQQTLLEISRRTGESDSDFVEKAMSVLSPIGKSFCGVDFNAMAKPGDPSGKKIKRAIESSLGKSGNVFYCLIDDTDQLASPSEPNHLNRIWGFLLAARAINETCDNLKFIISMRDEVWRRLNRDSAGQRDQVDHFRSLAKRIVFSDGVMKEIIRKRLIEAGKESGEKSTGSPYDPFFETTHVRIPTAEQAYRYWDDFVVGRSRKKPRDAIQLIYKLCDQAESSDRDKITSSDVGAVMPVYSEERVDDLKRECDLECPQIKDIIRAFHDADFDGGAFTLMPQSAADFINSLPSRFGITLFGRSITHNDRDDIFRLWRYLHEVGFLNARVSDSRGRMGYRHVDVEQDPDLISPSRWNDMQAILWEVNPAYRDYLIKIQSEKEFNFGRPKKPKGRRNR